MLDQDFVILAFVLNFLGGLSYLFAVLKGRAKPNRVSWFLWALMPFIAVVVQLEQGVGLNALTTFSSGFTPFVIFVASFFNKKAYWRLGILDWTCGGLALIGVFLWQITEVPNLALFFAIVADLLAGIPIVVKAYKAPETESPWTFLSGTINAVVGLLTLTVWDFAHVAFPVYLTCMCLLLFVLIRFRIGRFFAKKT